jgi:hypothetical protein
MATQAVGKIVPLLRLRSGRRHRVDGPGKAIESMPLRDFDNGVDFWGGGG